MNAPAFTPWPWFVSGKQTVRQDRRADMPVGACQPIAVMNWHDGPANANLIAAAPELYEALDGLRTAMACHDSTPEEFLALANAVAALAKAVQS